MEKKRGFEPGDMVATYTGQAGMVISEPTLTKARNHLKEGRRPGHYFAPGCCQNPDYITQVPVLFEDGKYDVMRSMNIKKILDVSTEKKGFIQGLIHDLGG